MDSGLLAARLIIGPLMAAHGAQKLFGWFGGYGVAGTAGFFETLGFRPGRLYASLAGVAELGGGLLVAVGLLGPVGPALLVAVMLAAAVSVHWANGVFAASNGIELPLVYGAAALALGLAGPGRYSADALLGWTSLWTPALVWGMLGAGIAGGLVSLSLRRPTPVAP